MMPARSTVDRVGYDFLDPAATQNILIFRDSGWDAADASVIALTTTTYDPVTGEILDADIEFNSTDVQLQQSIGDASSDMDLKNTAVHEIRPLPGDGAYAGRRTPTQPCTRERSPARHRSAISPATMPWPSPSSILRVSRTVIAYRLRPDCASYAPHPRPARTSQ